MPVFQRPKDIMVLRYINEIPVPEPLNGRAPELFKGPKPTAEITGLPNMTATCDPCGRWEIAVREEFRRFGNPECQNCGNPHVNWAAAMIPEELREKAREIYNAARGRPATRGGPAGATNRSNNAGPGGNRPHSNGTPDRPGAADAPNVAERPGDCHRR